MAIASMDISSIRALVARARRRLRLQSALEGATTAVILGSAAALATVFLVRAYIVAPDTGYLLLAGSGGIVAAGGVIAAVRRQDDEDIARQIDRASNLSDRLSTAVAFDRVLAGDPKQDDETIDLMRAAVKDAVKAAPKADLKRSTPFRVPRDTRVAALFALLAIAAAGLGLPSRDARVIGFVPERAGAGETVTITGEWLCGPRAYSDSQCLHDGETLVFSAEHKDTPIAPDDWHGSAIAFTVPDLPARPYMVTVKDGDRAIGTLRFEIVDRKEEKKKNPDAVTWDPDDRSYVKDLLQELQAQAKNDQSPELQAYVDKLRQLLQQADQGELSKEQLLDELQKAEDALHQGEEPKQEDVDKQLSDAGKQMEQNEQTKDLAKALEQGDMKKAQQEMEKLAQKLDKGDMTEKQQEDLAKALENAAKQMEQQQQQQEQQQQQQVDKAQKDVQDAQKQFDKEQDPQKKQDDERSLEDKKRKLEQLQKDKDKKDQSDERRSLKRLQKDLDDAAQSLKKNQKDKQNQDKQNQGDKQQGDKQNGGKQNQGDDQKGGQKQASQKMHDAAQEGGKIDDDKRKETTEKKVASQMDDLREAMRRAKRRGNKDGNNPFGKNGKQSDFERRARGGQGEKGAWEKGQQQGKGQNGGSSDQKPDGPSDTWGTGHDDDLTGDPTAKNGNSTDKSETGIQGKGPSRKETILSAAQKGFASKGYEKVYADYKQIVEEVMNSEKVPSSYKYYIKKYFTKIKPHSMD